ncbi:MAG: hypothetical protein Q3M30_16285 [Candidatus Electrothrix sp. Rat3]|nr:hypothetical protein [Candidatus Electrothrix rattekaaiensis]
MVEKNKNLIVEGRFYGDLNLWSLMKMLGATAKPDFDADLYELFISVQTGDTPSYHLEAAASVDVNIAGSDIDLAIEGAYFSLDYTKGPPATWSVNYSGYLKLMETGLYIYGAVGSSSGGLSLTGTIQMGHAEFSVDFSKSSSESTITATMQTGGSVTLQEIVYALGFSAFNIPTEIDPSFRSASISYDFGSAKCFSLAGSLTNRDEAVFAAVEDNGKWIYFFGIKIAQTLNLSNLPLIGKELSSAETLMIEDLLLQVSSAPLTAQDAARFNEVIPSGYPAVPSSGLAEDFAFFMTINIGGEKTTIDVGNSSTSQSGGSTNEGAPITPGTAQNQNPRSPTPSDSIKWINIQKNLGPVNFQKIGARYVSAAQSLWFEIDASLAMGPLTVSMDGLGIGSSIKDFEPQFSLQGMGIAWSKPPLEVAGAFVNMNPASGLEFEGGVTIGAENFELQAFGFYGDQTGSPSMFIFGDIAHDFGGPPAFFVTGAAMGLGYNSNLRLPTVDQVANFPFVQVLPNANPFNSNALHDDRTPLGVLQTIMGATPPWVTEQQGSLWFAAGITFTSFDIVNSQALVAVETGADLTISLLGTSHAQFPQQGQTHYANIVLDLDAVFKPEDGEFSIQAVLDKSSFLIDPACVLSGGFAFCIWYGDNPHAGDFVLTLGGYNPCFVPPSYYPTEPKLGFNWALDSSITISGNAYLAFTPSVMMAGGELSAVYQSGNLRAWFDAHADIIVHWKPFWFDADIGICVGASYRIDLLFTSCTVSVELGCNLQLWGPPTGGKVHVDWYIISFTIPFGAENNHSIKELTWQDVEKMLPNTGTATSRNILSLTPTAGVMPPGQPKASDIWVVRRGNFAFTASSVAPATTASAGNAQSLRPLSGSSFNVAPLNWTGVSASHAVIITNSGGDDASAHFSVNPIYKNLPASLWGTPTQSTPTGDAQLVMNQLVGVSVEINPPQAGATAGPVAIANLAHDNLVLTGAVLPIDSDAQPVGSVPAYSASSVATITDASNGVAATATISARNAIFKALQGMGYAPVTNNSDMASFNTQVGTALNDEPLLVA